MTLHKSYEISSFKARADQGEGVFEAVVSVYGNVDLQGDRVMPGAFEKSLDKWKSSGDPIPILWSHDWGDPFAHIGYVDPNDVREIRGKAGATPGGLLVQGHLDVHKPFAKQVYDLLAERRVKEFSFSYDIPAGGESRGKDGANELHTVDIIEVGPTLKGANPATMLLGTKSDTVPSDEEERRMKLRLDRAHDDELRMAIEKAGWDGAAAMQSCSNAADFRKISFERANDSDPDTAAHWALPHHSSPSADANPAGVAAALGALNGARGGAPDLKDKSAAQTHLEAHSSSEGKAQGKPWHVEKRGNEYCVIKDADNSEVACHATEEEANAQVRALYASEKAKFADDQPRDDHGRFSSDGSSSGGGGGGGGDVLPGTSITADDARTAAAAERTRTEGQDYGGADARVIVGPDGSVVDASSDYYWAKEAWRSAPEGSVLVEPDDTVIEGNGTTHAPKKDAPRPEAKAGRVIGAKAASALKDKLSSAIDSWVSDMNGGDGGGDTSQEKALREAIEGAGVIHDDFGPDPELTEFNAIIANLEIKK